MTRKGGRSIPESINQVEVENSKDQMKVCGTLKSDVLEGGVVFPNLVASIIYDTNPVHYLSIVA